MNENDRASIIAFTTLAQIEMQGMIAANQERESQGYAQAYSEGSFDSLHHDLRTKLAQHMVIT